MEIELSWVFFEFLSEKRGWVCLGSLQLVFVVNVSMEIEQSWVLFEFL